MLLDSISDMGEIYARGQVCFESTQHSKRRKREGDDVDINGEEDKDGEAEEELRAAGLGSHFRCFC